jgi:hypothetical protein
MIKRRVQDITNIIMENIITEGDKFLLLNNSQINQQLGDSVSDESLKQKEIKEKNKQKIQITDKIIEKINNYIQNNPNALISLYIKYLSKNKNDLIKELCNLFYFKTLNEGDIDSLFNNQEKFISFCNYLESFKTFMPETIDKSIVYSSINKDSLDTSAAKILNLNFIIHNNFNNIDFGAVNQSADILYKNKNIKNINLDIIQKLFKIFIIIFAYNFNFDSFYKENELLFNHYNQNPEKVKKDFEYFASFLKENKQVNSINPEIREKIISVSANLMSLKDKESFELIKKIKPEQKIPEIYQLNKQFAKFKFTVHDDMTFLLKEIGDITNCCQKLGGAGEEAAIDSWANGHAAVLVLECLIAGKWKIVSQSYFHYVTKEQDPNGPGVMLDNVESIKGMSQSSLLDEAYSQYAQYLKNNLNLNYVYCGKQYSDLNINSFSDKKLEKDPRKFVLEPMVKDLDHTDCLDLLQPGKSNKKSNLVLNEDEGEGEVEDESEGFKFKFLNASKNNYFVKIGALYLEAMSQLVKII